MLFLISAGETAEDRYAICRQVVVVQAEDWESGTATLTAFTREGGAWSRVPELSGIAVTVGRNGLGIGEGLHRSGFDGPVKREGDRRAPAGIFPIEFGFGTRARPGRKDGGLAYRRTNSRDRWVDDPDSRYYNRWVDPSEPGVVPDWKSAEILARPDGLYDLALVVGHNRREFLPGHGSAIFLHRWSAPGRPTIGCSAMDPEDLLRLWLWLEADGAPLLIQGPASFLVRLELPGGLAEALDQ